MSRVNDFNRILNGARVKLPGALDAQIKSELFMVIDQFMKKTQIWTENVDFEVNTTDLEYDIVPEMGLIDALHEVKNSDDVVVSAAMGVPGIIELESAPSQTDTFTAKVSLTVTDPLSATDLAQFPDWILAQYYPVFLDGLLARMMATLGKPYSNAQGAIFHGNKFSAGMTMADTNSKRKNLSGGQTWRYPKFA